MIIFNWLGIGFAVIGLGAGWLLASVIGRGESEDLCMILGGPIVSLIDVWYRNRYRTSLFRPGDGGSLFFLPVWMFGLVWLAIGVGRLVFHADI